VFYKAPAHYAPQWDRGIRWDAPAMGVRWPPAGPPVLSDKDRAWPVLRDAEVYA